MCLAIAVIYFDHLLLQTSGRVYASFNTAQTSITSHAFGHDRCEVMLVGAVLKLAYTLHEVCRSERALPWSKQKVGFGSLQGMGGYAPCSILSASFPSFTVIDVQFSS